MDFRFTPAQNELREKVRNFAKKFPADRYFCEVPDEGWGTGGYSKEYTRLMGEHGLLGIAWPKKYGGGGGTVMDYFIVKDELAYHNVPTQAHFANEGVGFAILENGSEELKREFLPKLAKGEILFCQGLSEPNAGSDLLNLKTAAVEDGDDFIINGRKIWTSYSPISDWVLLIARTDFEAPNHQSLSSFLVDLSLPGVTRRPIKNMTDDENVFSEVIFEDVRVPKKYLLGAKNEGFKQVLYALETDRFWSRSTRAGYTGRLVKEMIAYCKETVANGKPLIEEPEIGRRIVDLAVKTEVAKVLNYRAISYMDQGLKLTHQSSMVALFADYLAGETSDTWLRIFGPAAQIMGYKYSKFGKRMEQAAREWLFAPGYLIAGGTPQIQRNTIALRGLKLPRS